MQATDFVNRQMAIEKIREIAHRKEAEMKKAGPDEAERLAFEINGLYLAIVAIRLV